MMNRVTVILLRALPLPRPVPSSRPSVRPHTCVHPFSVLRIRVEAYASLIRRISLANIWKRFVIPSNMTHVHLSCLVVFPLIVLSFSFYTCPVFSLSGVFLPRRIFPLTAKLARAARRYHLIFSRRLSATRSCTQPARGAASETAARVLLR
jgi:hypothetical protein